jgi:phosphoethanolamine N-methyltransferase
MSQNEPEYDDLSIRFLEALWGDGFLSPGGPDEVRRVIADVDFSDKMVLDIGCGSGGITLFLARETPLKHITGFDIEEPVIAAARNRSAREGAQERVAFVKGQPGPLPFADASFDIVFSKDALIHVADKEALFSEISRVLTPGGIFVASDWLTSHDGPPSDAMTAYLAAEGLSFGMASPSRYEAALRKAGFVDVRSRNRNHWYRDQARVELERLKGPLYEKVAAEVGEELVRKNIKTWTAMIKVLDSGEHCPTHLYARLSDVSDTKGTQA